MANEITRPSINLLPMEDIKDWLKNEEFLQEEDSEAIVQIVKDSEELAWADGDKDTVTNAKKLGGIDAEDYLLHQEGLAISKEAYKEIIALKSELYFLKSNLVKRGFLEHMSAASGFYDPFRYDNKIYEQQSIECGAIGDMASGEDELALDNHDNLREGEFVAIHGELDTGGDVPSKRVYVRRIVQKGADSVTFDRNIEFTAAGNLHNIELYRYSGQYYRGSFIFGEEAEGIPGEERFSSLDDERYQYQAKLEPGKPGYAYTFVFSDDTDGALADPVTKQGFVTKFKIRARATGSPGGLMCYIMRLEDMGGFDLGSGANAVAVSAPVTAPSGTAFNMLTFDFKQGDQYPLVKTRKDDHPNPDEASRQIYCALVVCAGNLDASSYWEILTLQSESQDELHANNVLYEFRPGQSPKFLTNSDINKADFWYRVGMRRYLERNMILRSEGLYTACFGSLDPIYGSVAQTILRINREGQSYTDGHGTSLEYSPAIEDFRFNQEGQDGLAVVGNKIREVQSSGHGTVTLKKAVPPQGEAPAYPVNFQIWLRARNKYFDETAGAYAYKDEIFINLPLKHLIADPHRLNKEASDRLVFEAPLKEPGGETALYNDFELQIFWRTTFRGSTEDLNQRTELLGQIHELSVAFNNDTGGQL